MKHPPFILATCASNMLCVLSCDWHICPLPIALQATATLLCPQSAVLFSPRWVSGTPKFKLGLRVYRLSFLSRCHVNTAVLFGQKATSQTPVNRVLLSQTPDPDEAPRAARTACLQFEKRWNSCVARLPVVCSAYNIHCRQHRVLSVSFLKIKLWVIPKQNKQKDLTRHAAHRNWGSDIYK